MKILIKRLFLIFAFSQAVHAQPIDIGVIQDQIYLDDTESWTDIVLEHEKSNDRITSTVQCKLDDCIVQALNNNPSIRKSYNEIKSQEKALLASRRAWLPTLSISANPLFGS